MMITDVLFDLDDTLCDFTGARNRGLTAAFSLLPADSRADALTLWNEREPDLFRSFAAKEVDRDQYRYERFEMVLENAEVPDRAAAIAEMNSLFMTEVNDRIGLMPGALDCLETLRARSIRCHLLTNGPTDGQRKKIERLGLERLLDYIQIGEEAGVFKPDPRAYEMALDHVGRPASSVVMVGDSLVDDIAAAAALGIHTVHISKNGEPGSISTLAAVPQALDVLQRIANE